MSYHKYHDYPSRTLCSVLEDMRNCYKTYHFAAIAGLIEEAQALANRMEAAIQDAGSIEDIRKHRIKAKDELRRLEKEINQAQAKLDKLKENLPSKAEKKELKKAYKEAEKKKEAENDWNNFRDKE